MGVFHAHKSACLCNFEQFNANHMIKPLLVSASLATALLAEADLVARFPMDVNASGEIVESVSG